MEWVEGQYEQCAYGGKMLGGHWGKKADSKQCRAMCSPPRHGSDYNLKNVDALQCHTS